MDENSVQGNTEITQEMKNPTLSDKDRELWTLFVHKTKESLETTVRQNEMEGERKKPPQSTPKNSPRPQAPKRRERGKGKTEETLTEPNLNTEHYPFNTIFTQPPRTYCEFIATTYVLTMTYIFSTNKKCMEQPK